jgi:hypothetical protein
VRLVRVRADISHLGFAPFVVALVTHILGILFLVFVGTAVNGFWLLGDLNDLRIILDHLIVRDIKTLFYFLVGGLLLLEHVEDLP